VSVRLSRPSGFGASSVSVLQIPADEGGGWTGPAGALHHWPMDDANVSGTTITDIGSSPINGTAGSGVASAAGPVTQARSFDGTANGEIAFASRTVPGTKLLSPHSGTMWVYVTDHTAQGGGSSPQTFFVGGEDTANWIRVACDPGTPGGLNVTIWSNDAGQIVQVSSNAQILSSATWKCIGWRWDGAGALEIFADGVEITNVGGSGLGAPSAAVNWLGTRDTDGTGSLTGRIGRTLIYPSVLSDADMLAIFTAGG
jgi:hypothetical protein